MTDDTQALIAALRAGAGEFNQQAESCQKRAWQCAHEEVRAQLYVDMMRYQDRAALLTAHADSLASDVGPTRKDIFDYLSPFKPTDEWDKGWNAAIKIVAKDYIFFARAASQEQSK